MRILLFVLAGLIVGGVLLPVGLYYVATEEDARQHRQRWDRFGDAFGCCLGFVGLSGVAGGVLGGLAGWRVDRWARRRGGCWDWPTGAVAVFLLAMLALGVVLCVKAFLYINRQ